MILGLSFGIDSAAAVVVGSDPVAAAAEERFDRRKHSRAFPKLSLRRCLAHAGALPGDIERVGFFWNPGEHLRALDPRRAASYRDHREYLELVPAQLLALDGGRDPVRECEQVFRFGKSRRPLHVHYFPHHLCHAAAAFYTSGFERAAFLIADGYGERTALTMGVGEGEQLTPLSEVHYPNSLGAVYAAVTEHLGFAPNSGEGTVMALAALGEASFSEEFERVVTLEPEGRLRVDASYFGFAPGSLRRCSDRFVETFGPPRAPGEELTDRHRDLAATVQRRTEEALVHAARWLRDASGARALVMAGGVALNSVANTRILEECGFESLNTFPAPADSGAALGAALLVAHGTLGRPRGEQPYSDFLGPASEARPQDVFAAAGQHFVELERPEAEAARRIAAGQIIGWYQGRMELGPRALGNRSILADPRQEKTKELLNRRVKHREPFRPFAPAALEEAAGEFFEGTLPSPFMTRVHRVKPGLREHIPAVLHADGTARLQTVSARQNPLFHALIASFRDRTGLPIVLNTSFNDNGEPIVESLSDALRCFHSTGLDALIAGNCLIEKARSS